MSLPRLRPTSHQPQALSDLAERHHWRWHQPDLGVSVTGISLDSQTVQPGDLFVALPGRAQHGARFAPAALDAGARAILTDPDGLQVLGKIDSAVPIAVVDQPREKLGQLAAEIYDPGVALPPVLAVTGTNGKTSVVFFLDDIARAMGLVSAMSNTHERRIAHERISTPLTTPEAPDLQALLAVAAEAGAQLMALEASAQAIERQRLDGVSVAVAGFTNLSHDHLEDYGDMDRYFSTKAALFDPQVTRSAVVSLETEWGERLARHTSVPVVTVGRPDQSPTWALELTESSLEGTSFVLRGPSGQISSSVRALGEHMVRNAALAIVMLIEAGYGLEHLEAAIGLAAGGIRRVVPGRLERVSGASDLAVFVDAGRSPDAYQHTLSTLRPLCSGRLIVVCGTSGNRDRSKRAEMGRIAAHYGDVVLVSDDDPRREDPAHIRADILAGARGESDTVVEEIPEQERAIRRAIELAAPGDTVVWIGPGSQSYRDVGGQRLPFSARHEAQAALIDAGYLDQASEVAR